jgi:diamine N-acetyltransferase
MIAPRIVSENLILRPLEKEELPYKVRWYNDPEVSKTLILSERLELDKTIQWFSGIRNNPSRIDWLIENTNCRPIGLISLVAMDAKQKSAEIYIVIGEKDCWGKGVMLDAETQVIGWAFDVLKLKTIRAEARMDNIASAITMKKLGFEINKALTKKQIINGQTVDILHFDLQRENFKTPHKSPNT